MAFSPDGRSVAGAGFGMRSVRVWPVSKPTSSRALPVGHRGVNSVTFDSSGQFIIAASPGGEVWAFDLASGRRQEVVAPASGTFYPPERLTAQVSRQRTLLAVGSDDGTLTVAGTGNGSRDFTTQTAAGDVNDLDFSPDGETIATAQANGSVRLFAVSAADQLLAVLHPSPTATEDVAFSPDGRFVAAADNNRMTRIWERSGRMVWSVPSGAGPRASFSPDSELLAVAGSTGTAVWPIMSRHPTLRFPGASSEATFSPDGMLLAIAERNGDVSVRRISDGQVVEELTSGRRGALRRIAFSPDGSRLLALSSDGIARIWNLDEQRVVLRLGSRGSRVSDAAFSPDGGELATVRGPRVVVTDLESGQGSVSAQLSADSFESVAYSSDGRHILVAGSDGRATVLDATELRPVTTFIGSGESLTSAAFSPSGTRVGISGDGAVRVFRCEVCAPPSRLLAIAQSMVTRALSPAERRQYLHESD